MFTCPGSSVVVVVGGVLLAEESKDAENVNAQVGNATVACGNARARKWSDVCLGSSHDGRNAR